MIDTHCHLTDEAFASDAEACIINAQQAGVDKVMLACCEQGDLMPIAHLCNLHPGVVFGSAGIHPENMEADVIAQLQRMRQCCTSMQDTLRLYAIGEIGIDLHWDKTRLADQLLLLEAEFDWALEADLPVILHIRDAMPEFLSFLRAYINKKGGASRLRGVLHCYSGTAEEAAEAMQMADLYLGVGGTLTYKRSTVPDVVKRIGIDRIILETDAPYLAPVPYRGKRNEPAYTAQTARFLAEILGIGIDEVDRITTCNAELLFGI